MKKLGKEFGSLLYENFIFFLSFTQQIQNKSNWHQNVNTIMFVTVLIRLKEALYCIKGVIRNFLYNACTAHSNYVLPINANPLSQNSLNVWR